MVQRERQDMIFRCQPDEHRPAHRTCAQVEGLAEEFADQVPGFGLGARCGDPQRNDGVGQDHIWCESHPQRFVPGGNR
jgi:hypothetical protein